MATSFKRSHAGTVARSAPNPAVGHCQPTPPLDTHGQVWVSLLWGHCSFLLGPGAHKFLFVPCPVSPVLCKFWQLYGGLMVKLPVRGLMPYPSLLHPEPLPLQQSTADPYLLRKSPNTVLSQSLWGLWVLVHTVHV